MQIILNNLLVSYVQVGDTDSTILMLHGWGSNKESFDGLIREYSKTHTVVAVDFPFP